MYSAPLYFLLVSCVTCSPTSQNGDFFGDSFANMFGGKSFGRALSSTFDRAPQMNPFNGYFQEQQSKISTEINKYIANVKESGRQITDSFSFLPGEDSTSNLQNPDVVLTVPARIARNGYKCETHTIVSKGYILNVHRIPHSKNNRDISSKVVLLQHGLFTSSADWIMNGPDKALAYVLADAGYDVWMPNTRGNEYSKEHAWLKSDSKSYWNFSWHEMGVYDIPAIIKYIMKLKGKGTKITYIGHSMGTTMFFAMLSLRPEYNKILSAGYALAPVVFMTDFRCPVKPYAPLANNLAHIEMLYGFYEFMPKDSLFGTLAGSCKTDYLDKEVCKSLVFEMCGENEKQYNDTILPVFLAHYGVGTSWKTIVHFAQLIVVEDKFQQFDYGPVNNQKIYGTERPPEYDLSKVTLPIKLFWTKNDYLSSEKAVKRLLARLPPTSESYLVPDPKFNHLDHLWAVDAPKLINAEILSTLQKTFGENNQ